MLSKGMPMRSTDSIPDVNTRFLVLILVMLALPESVSCQFWSHRLPVTITNHGTAYLYDYQVNIVLTGSGFDFSKALPDGRDIKVTSSDGVSELPFWLEEWDQAGSAGNLWIKLPTLPLEGTTVYIYYGNPDPVILPQDPVETPPTGLFMKDYRNPIDTIAGSPYDASAVLLAENIVYDESTGHYWMVFANYEDGSIGLIWSDDPTNPQAWNWHPGNPLFAGNAPHIMEHEGTWYIFYASGGHVVARTSSSAGGPYSTTVTTLLEDGLAGTWEDLRVDEPYVFRRNDGKWIMLYMGDAGGAVEQVSYATADNILGPYTKFGADPFIPFGPEGSYDAGTVADPWVYELNGVYYIGYTVSPTNHSPWQTAMATTTDWQSIKKIGVILPRGAEFNSFRGAVIRIGDEYLFSYTGGPASGEYRLCLATQPVYQAPARYTDNAENVFEFFDGFEGSSLDLNKWTIINGTEDQITIRGDTMILTGISGSYVRINGNMPFGFGYLGETRGRHLNWPAVSMMIVEYGFGQQTGFDLRLTDNYRWTNRYQRYVMTDSLSFGPLTDVDWHTYGIYRESPGTAGFMIDNSVETVTSGVPTSLLYPFLISYTSSGLGDNYFVIDWTRVRKWAGYDPVVITGSEEDLNSVWTGAVSRDWNSPGNWTSGVPQSYNLITIPTAVNIPLFNGSLYLNTTNSLTIDAGGGLTVTGDLNSLGRITIGSTIASSGSLIVNGTATGDITYNRQLQPGDNNAANWHLAAPPVTANSNANTGKITTVYQWSEPTGTWTTAGITSAVSGRGYNIRQEPGSDGVISFTGPIANGDVTFDASSPFADAASTDVSYFDRTYVIGRSTENPGGRGWNLLGNPYPSAISAESFILTNYNAAPGQSQFDPNHVALYLFDGTTRGYYYLARSTGWPSGSYLDETHVQAGQGFFVMAMDDDSQFTFSKSMQAHSTATPMLKSVGTDERWPGLQLKAKHASGAVVTTVVYGGEMTTGVDPGYDIGLYRSGQGMELYTLLAMKDNGINYTRQALPVAGADTLAIPVGVDFKSGGEVTFSAVTVPVDGRRFWLSDKVAGTFTELGLKSYTVTLPADTYGTGRFFIIASANTPTDVRHPEATEGDLRIWVSGGLVIIDGVVCEGSLCEIFDIQGRKLLERKLSDGDLNTIDLPGEMHGVLAVKVTDGERVVTRKVVVP